jgi:hypothetical protein
MTFYIDADQWGLILFIIWFISWSAISIIVPIVETISKHAEDKSSSA